MAIPLDPGAGGHTVPSSTLRVADIIVSTTNANVSRAIRVGTGSSVSHAMLYVGDDLVVEAIGDGVVLRPLASALQEATLAVAYRHHRLRSDETRAMQVRDFVGHQIDKDYNYAGLAGAGPVRRLLCATSLMHPTGPILCLLSTAQGMRPARDVAFFCSELVTRAFESVDLPLGTRANQMTPEGLARLRFTALGYVGHLIT